MGNGAAWGSTPRAATVGFPAVDLPGGPRRPVCHYRKPEHVRDYVLVEGAVGDDSPLRLGLLAITLLPVFRGAARTNGTVQGIQLLK